MDLSGRTDHFVPAVGQREESPHASSWREPRPHQGGEHLAHGVGHHCQASTGGQQIPCNPPSLGGIQLASSSDADRGGGAHGCGEQGMANFGQAGLHVGLDLQHDISAARAPTEEPTGQSCFRLSSADVLALRLGNSNNFCYMNSVAICLLWVCTQFPDQVMIPSMVCKLLQGAARSGQVFHVWHSFTWKAILAGWSRPLLQHDVAEFLYFVCPKFPLFNFLNGHWQARELDDLTCRITDRGGTIPLALEFNSNEAEHPCLVQDLIDGWHQQAQVHGLLRRPEILCLQVCRFTRVGNDIRKSHRRVIPEARITVPVFTGPDDLQCSMCGFCLNAAIFHTGPTPSCGHYQSLLWMNDRGVFMSDDGKAAVSLTDSDASSMHSKLYLLFYVCDNA